MKYFVLFSTLCAVVYGVVDPELLKRPLTKPIDFDAHRRTDPVDEDMTRLLKVDYSFRAESVLYDTIDNKEKAPSTVISGNFSFETLHHDMEGSMLARFTITQCDTDNCGSSPPVYVAFRQGGNNIEEVLVNNSEQADHQQTWNFLLSVVNTIYTPAEYGEGDEQYVDTVYGRCKTHFGRPEDKRFRRKINNCELGYGLNFTRFAGLENVEYDQDVWYTQNTKVDADIVIIDAIEMLSFRVPFHEKHGFQLESRTHVEITNRTRVFIKKNCATEVTAANCAREAFGATTIGKKKYEDVKMTAAERPELSTLVENYRNHLHEMGDTHTCEQHSKLFAAISQTARFASRSDWEHVIRQPENEPVLPTIANALGAVGTVESVDIAREVLLVDDPTLIDDFLFGCAHSYSRNEKWHKQLMYWLGSLDVHSDAYWKAANTVATVLGKRCEHSVSTLNSCNKGKETIVNKFIRDLSSSSSDEATKIRMFETLLNLPIQPVYELAKLHLCDGHLSRVQTAALNVILHADNSIYDSQLIKKLINIFRNTCSTETSTSESQIAVDILLRCLPEHQHVATLLLRSETLNPTDQEKWNYLYKAISATGEKDELKTELWRRMRQFKVFRPNYSHRALVADSFAHWQQIAEVSGFRLFSSSAAEFDRKTFKRSTFDLNLKKGKKEENVFSLSIDTNGLDQYISTGETKQSGEPEANIRLGLLGHSLPSFVVFKGNSDMLSAVWNADGQTIKAFEGHVSLRDTVITLPLLSGLTVDVSSHGAASLRVLAAAEVSFWNRDSAASLQANISMSMTVSASMSHHSVVIREINSSLSALTTISSHTDVNFSALPYSFCLTSEQGDVVTSQTTVIKQSEKPKLSTVTRRRVFPAFTYRLDESTTNQCNGYLKEVGGV